MDRRDFLKAAGLAAASLLVSDGSASAGSKPARPNIILCMTDDQGWGDVGYNGNKIIKTPVLDEMAASGLRFNRFYAAAPVCSPTRGSVMTGRHPNRFGCFAPNYSIRPEEITIAEVLRDAGYATGHFGKWHLGPVKADCPVNPGNSGFEQWLSHDNFFEIDPPLTRNGAPPQTYKGESAEIIVKEALGFIEKALHDSRSFFVVVWFGSPHNPHVALPEDRALYKDLPKADQHYLGEITAVDRAMGMLRSGLADMKVGDDTLLWFCSDNGATPIGSTGGLRGNKASLWEGGIRVPGIIEWAAKVRKPASTEIPCCTSDIYPTIIDILNLKVANQVEPIDGISLRPLIEGKMRQRPRPIAFWIYPAGGEGKNPSYIDRDLLKGTWRQFSNFRHPKPRTENFAGHAALIDNRYKLHRVGADLELYDLVADAAETKNLAGENPQIVAKMKTALDAWQASVEKSLAGQDYKAG